MYMQLFLKGVLPKIKIDLSQEISENIPCSHEYSDIRFDGFISKVASSLLKILLLGIALPGNDPLYELNDSPLFLPDLYGTIQ
ncbi:hypothetical protein NQ315_007485 [Exocentrus adspersus]|uniref:Cytochrome b n=1 Tax=Exocentrus adspersus TaxID=1586481 RepID=A0AAV8V7K6_9CUCU|nr:hypothetical protein NQ315_007485 [Exocentrus adspersus]